MRNLATDRFLVSVSGTRTRTTHDDETAACSIASGMSAWPEHVGREVTVIDRHAPTREVESIFGGTKVDARPPVIWRGTARKVA